MANTAIHLRRSFFLCPECHRYIPSLSPRHPDVRGLLALCEGCHLLRIAYTHANRDSRPRKTPVNGVFRGVEGGVEVLNFAPRIFNEDHLERCIKIIEG